MLELPPQTTEGAWLKVYRPSCVVFQDTEDYPPHSDTLIPLQRTPDRLAMTRTVDEMLGIGIQVAVDDGTTVAVKKRWSLQGVLETDPDTLRNDYHPVPVGFVGPCIA